MFKPYSLRSVNGVAVAVIGQAFPYTPIANPRHMVPDWSFGIQEPRVQQLVDEVRTKGARLVVLLSHNGMDVDLKLASRIRGIDVILGGHTHDGVPAPVTVGKTLVTNAGSNGKFLARARPGREGRRTSPPTATGCCRCSRTCCPRMRRWPSYIAAHARASRSEAARRSSRSPKACSTAGAASTAPGTS